MADDPSFYGRVSMVEKETAVLRDVFEDRPRRGYRDITHYAASLWITGFPVSDAPFLAEFL